jgi:predicted amidohydrolase YtcJ
MKKLFKNGNIYLGNNQWGTELLVEDGMIQEVSQGSIQADGAEVIDMENQYLFPGFEDAHTHPGSRCRMLVELDARSASNWEEAREMMMNYIEENPDRERYVIHGWNDATWGPITDKMLDGLTEKFLLVMNVSYHGGVANTSALRWLQNQIPELHHEEGNIEEEQFVLVATATLPTYDELLELIPAYQKKLVALGVTSVHDMHLASEDQLRAYTHLSETNRLPMYTVAYVNPVLLNSDVLKELLTKDLQHFRVAGLKLFLDGAIGLRTAKLSEPYTDTGTYGVYSLTKEQVRTYITQASELGLKQMAVHAIGDEAVTLTLDVFEQFEQEGVSVKGWRIEHAEMLTTSDIQRIAKLGVHPIMQPNFHWDLDHYHDRLSDKQMQYINPFRSVADAGTTLVFGSDGMPEGPLIGLDYAMNRHKYPQQVITLEEALAAYTTGGSHVVGGPKRGEIKEGIQANLVLLKENPFKQSSIRDIEISGVWIRGEQQN